MTFQECSAIRTKNIHLIGTVINQEGIDYLISDILITPPDNFIKTYLSDYKDSYNHLEAISRFITRDDLTLRLFGTNLQTMEDAVLLYLDLVM